MKNMDMVKKTMPFILARFGLYLLVNIGLIIYCILVLLLCLGMGGSISAFILLIGVIVGFGLYFKITDYINYLVKASHIAVISELAVNGTVPEGTSMIKYGQEQVKKRFVATTVFYGINGLVSGAVKQIQNAISKVGSWFGNIDAVKTIVSIINIFVGIVLGYVDEAVLARIFYKKDEGAWKGAADGVVLYFQNWKEILKNAVGLVIFILLFYGIGTALTYGLTYGIIVLFAEESILTTIIALISAALLIDAVKQSFVDSYITISVVNKYMVVTANQTPAVDLCEKAKGWSKKFKELCGKAEAEVVAAPAAVATALTPNQEAIATQPVVAPNPQTVQPQMNTVAQPQPVMQQMPPTNVPAQPQVVTGQSLEATQLFQPVMDQNVAQPVVQQPTVAPVVQPVQPVVQPVQPMVQPAVQPVQPVVQQPAVQPVQPVVQQPTIQPVQPVVQQPVQPVLEPQNINNSNGTNV